MRTNLRFFNVVLVGVLVLTALLGSTTTPAKADDPITVFINEIHYDNAGTDANEAIEVAGPAGTDLAEWSIVLYNGNGGAIYGTTITLGGIITNQQNGFGTLNFPYSGIQNGNPDGLALVKPDNSVVQFLSYGGSFTAVGGVADGMTSTDIGKTEGSTTPVGFSLQLTGSGSSYDDFTWADPMAATAGAVNTGQTFVTVTNQPIIPTCPASINLEPGQSTSESFSALDADGVVVSAEITSVSVTGISLSDVVPGTVVNEALTGSLVVADTTAEGSYPVEITFTNNDSPIAQTATCTVPVSITPPWTAPEIYINEVDADTPGDDALEFVELYDGGNGNTSLDGLVVVFFNGSDDQSYESFDLDGYSTDASGYFVLGNGAVTGVDLVFANNVLQNGADAVALYAGDAADFPNDTPLTTAQLIDAVVYDTNDSDDAGLLPLLNAGQPQVNEAGGGNSAVDSNQRCPNGTGGLRNTESFGQFAPTPGEENTCNYSIFPTCPAPISILQGETALEPFSAVDQDGIVVSADIMVDPVSSGITLTSVSPATALNEPLTGSLVVADTTPEGVYSVEISFSNSDTPVAQTATCTVPVSVIVPAPCLVDTYEIGEVQGTGMESPLLGQAVTISGVVTSVNQDSGELGGFFLQDSDGDGDAQTSDGIFVYSSTPVSEGYYVQVNGTPAEYFGNTQIGSGSTVSVCTPPDDKPTTVTPIEISLPVTAESDLEKYEGMLVTFPQELTISEYFNFDRYGEIVLTTDRFLTPTAQYEPGSPEAMQAMENYLLNRIVLDDGRTTQNPDPAYHPNGLDFTLENLFRGGDTLQNVTGTIYYSFDLYRVVPTIGADYTPANPRTATHDSVGGSLKVASFNVLNYFTTLGSRGADTAEEFTRQRDKIIAAISAIDADIVGLIEIENNTEAIADLVNGLNAVMGAGTYAYVDTGVIGTDEIKVAFIYKTATVSLVGDYEILDSSVDPNFIDTKNRPVLAQTFEEIINGEKVTIAVNHLKSKGSACAGDPDLDDGAGNCNLTRTAAAKALVEWLATDPTGSGDPDFLIIGDLNAYDKEDPIDAILAGADGTMDTDDDYSDLVYRFIGEDAYSYVFDGQVGYLDHALANDSLNVQLTGTTIWHINADEADLIDYDMTFKKDAQDAIYAPDAYRSSDHDPVIIGLSLGNIIPITSGTIIYLPVIFR